MTDAHPRHVVIWLDGYHAVLLVLENESSAVPHLQGSGDGCLQRQIDARQCWSMHHYHDAVLAYLEPENEILLLGPGQAKQELRRQIERHRGLKGKVVGLYHASELATAELVFPVSDAWHLEGQGWNGVPL